MIFIRRFMTQKIPVRPGFFKQSVAFFLLLSYGQRNGAPGKFLTDSSYDLCHSLIIEIRILSSLKDKGTKSQFIPCPAAVQDLFLGQPVPGGVFVASADPAVIAVVFTVIGKFNKSPDKDPFSIDPVSQIRGPSRQFPLPLFAAAFQEDPPLFLR